METKNVILELRTKKGLSQDELAEKVMVTRQAVSRWENGETVPNTETLKLLSKEFNVTINTLLGAPRQLICQCCGMPLEDEIVSHDRDGSLNENYCKWCYADGTYTYSNMDDLIDVCVKHMINQGFTEEQARAHMKATLPTLDYWKKYEQLSDDGQFEMFKEQLIKEINELPIEGMPKVERLNPMPPSLVALPPIATTISWQPSSKAASISSPVPYVDACMGFLSSSFSRGSPEAAAISSTALFSPIRPK